MAKINRPEKLLAIGVSDTMYIRSMVSRVAQILSSYNDIDVDVVFGSQYCFVTSFPGLVRFVDAHNDCTIGITRLTDRYVVAARVGPKTVEMSIDRMTIDMKYKPMHFQPQESIKLIIDDIMQWVDNRQPLADVEFECQSTSFSDRSVTSYSIIMDNISTDAFGSDNVTISNLQEVANNRIHPFTFKSLTVCVNNDALTIKGETNAHI